MSAEETVLVYPRASRLDGRDLLLATPEPRPLFEGFLAEPEQGAALLLLLARVARTRFWTPPGMVAAAIAAADPVVTGDRDRLRLESFSLCCGVHARVDLLPDVLDGATPERGTTNVDLGPQTREALAGVAAGEPLHLHVGLDEVRLSTLSGTAVERRVPLPARWRPGFAETALVTDGMRPRLTLDATATRRFVAALPRSASRAPAWAVATAGGARLSTRPAPGAVCASGGERLRVLEPLLRFASGLTAYGPDVVATTGPVASTWVLDVAGARISVTLSPEPSRGFSGEGEALLGLATGEPRSLAAAAGALGHDVVDDVWFARDLRGPQPAEPPRLVRARALVASGEVRAVEGGADVTTHDEDGAAVHRVRGLADAGGTGGWTGGRTATCTCPWYGRHRGARGPCAHVLAAVLVGAATLDDDVAPA